MIAKIHNFANAIRALSIDMTNEANSGHQGTPLGFADVLSVLFNDVMNFSPKNPMRDRLILSAGHAVAMLYSAIYLTQKTSLSLDDLKRYRKFGAICQGHPEIDHDIGVEMTTGALGQGIATAVGIAIALKKKKLESKVFVIVGDGCLMEGVSHEAMTLASKLNLNNLIVLFDNNDVCIDGHSSEYTTDNISRFKAYGFDILEADGHDYKEIKETLKTAKSSKKPVFISFKTKIGFPAKKNGSPDCHGKFISDGEAKEIRRSFGFSENPFDIPDSILWEKSAPTFVPMEDDEKGRLDQLKLHEVINGLKDKFSKSDEQKSTRELGGLVLSRLSIEFPSIIGGSADLSKSNCTISKYHKIITADYFEGNYIHYGIREHAMGCIMNGLAIEGFIPYGGTFLVFSDYMRGAIRNAAIMNVAPIFIFTHDSIAVGEDGKTHQPIEQLSSLRLIPNLNIMRPACGVEIAECLELAICNRRTPTALVLSRQAVSNVRRNHEQENLCKFGMYQVADFENNEKPRISLIATGSEVSLALKVKKELDDINIRIISAPCLELFDTTPENYKRQMLDGRKLFLEAGSPDVWYRYKTRADDLILGISEYGESGTVDELFKKFGFTVENIKKLIGNVNN